MKLLKSQLDTGIGDRLDILAAAPQLNGEYLGRRDTHLGDLVPERGEGI